MRLLLNKTSGSWLYQLYQHIMGVQVGHYYLVLPLESLKVIRLELVKINWFCGDKKGVDVVSESSSIPPDKLGLFRSNPL